MISLRSNKPIKNKLIKPTAEISENAKEAEGVRRSSRIRKLAITDDYIVYLQESDFDIGPKDDPTSFS